MEEVLPFVQAPDWAVQGVGLSVLVPDWPRLEVKVRLHDRFSLETDDAVSEL